MELEREALEARAVHPAELRRDVVAARHVGAEQQPFEWYRRAAANEQRSDVGRDGRVVVGAAGGGLRRQRLPGLTIVGADAPLDLCAVGERGVMDSDAAADEGERTAAARRVGGGRRAVAGAQLRRARLAALEGRQRPHDTRRLGALPRHVRLVPVLLLVAPRIVAGGERAEPACELGAAGKVGVPCGRVADGDRQPARAARRQPRRERRRRRLGGLAAELAALAAPLERARLPAALLLRLQRRRRARASASASSAASAASAGASAARRAASIPPRSVALSCAM